MITYRWRSFLTVAEAWYSPDLQGLRPDIIHFRYLDRPPDDGPVEEFHTIWIDLSQDEERLVADMNKTTRYDLRKAAEYGFRYEFWHPGLTEQLDEFADFFDASNAAKGLPPADRQSLRAYAACGVLDLSRVCDRDGKILVCHAHYRDATHARPSHTGSIHRSQPDSALRTLLGRANRWGSWQDILRMKRAGISLYDFGGWYPGVENKELLAVNFFKEGFGGRTVKTFVCTRPGTLKGRLYLAASRWRARFLRQRGPAGTA
jgi:hypothetical protein